MQADLCLEAETQGLFQKSLQTASATGKGFSAMPSSLCPEGNQ